MSLKGADALAVVSGEL